MCPDTLLATGTGSQDVSIVAGDVINNRRCIEYSRPLSTGKCAIYNGSSLLI